MAKKGPIMVLDASGVNRSGNDYSRGDYFITNLVYGEVWGDMERTALDAAISTNLLKVDDPDESSTKEVLEKAKETGDIHFLSAADISCLALCVQMGADLVSDDYPMQNVSKALNIKVIKTQAEGIKGEVRWGFRCQGCRKKLGGPGVCPICGHSTRRYRL